MATQSGYSLDYPPGDEFQDSTDFFAGYALDPVRNPMDGEPDNNHGADDNQWSENNPLKDSVIPTPIHQRDRGTVAARKYRLPLMESSDETHTNLRFTPSDGVERSVFGLERGANAYGENNPADTVQRTPGDPNEAESPRVGWAGAPRPGLRIQRWNERKIPNTVTRFDHAPRGLRTHVAKTAGDTTPVTNQGNQYASPFTALANTRVGNFLHPMLRREPRQWDESATVDGSEQALAESVGQYESWGL
jgi:hypothetical protein